MDPRNLSGPGTAVVLIPFWTSPQTRGEGHAFRLFAVLAERPPAWSEGNRIPVCGNSGDRSTQLAASRRESAWIHRSAQAHFQGFCRDLYTESAQTIVFRVRASLQVLVQAQFAAHRALDHGNPNINNLTMHFQRFGFKLNLAAADPANPTRLQGLTELSRWRNIAAHHGTVPPSGLPSLAELRRWSNSCTGLAISLDGIMYNELRKILRRTPWVP